MLAHLAELEERRLPLQLGFPSLFAYCVEALGLSEGAAGRRVAAARVCRRFPEAFELVARGDLHLSALCGLAPHLNSQNATELFTACCRKTCRQVDELLATRFPKPDVREQIRRLPVRGLAAPARTDSPIPDRTHTREEALTGAGVNGHAHPAAPMETAGIAEDCGSEKAAPSAVDAARPPSPSRRRELEPLSADRFAVHFTADVELGKLNLVTWDITSESYAQCVKESVAAVGVSGRSEGDDGREVWTVAYVKDTEKVGYVSCVDFSDGHHMTFATGFN